MWFPLLVKKRTCMFNFITSNTEKRKNSMAWIHRCVLPHLKFVICGFAGVFMIQCTILHPNTQMIHPRSNDKRIAKKLECFKCTIRFTYFQFCQATSLHTSGEHLRYLDLTPHHQQNSCEREVNWRETNNGTICHCHLKLKSKIYFFSRMLHFNNSWFSL